MMLCCREIRSCQHFANRLRVADDRSRCKWWPVGIGPPHRAWHYQRAQAPVGGGRWAGALAPSGWVQGQNGVAPPGRQRKWSHSLVLMKERPSHRLYPAAIVSRATASAGRHPDGLGASTTRAEVSRHAAARAWARAGWRRGPSGRLQSSCQRPASSCERPAGASTRSARTRSHRQDGSGRGPAVSP
jgi:hypothetical protein